MDFHSQYKLWSLALGLELSSLFLLRSKGDFLFWSYWLTHATACAIAASVAWTAMPKAWQRPRLLSTTLIFLLTLSFPLIGVIGLLLTIRLVLARPRALSFTGAIKQPPELIILPARPGEKSEKECLPPGMIARIASNPNYATGRRIQAVLALREMMPRLAIPILQKLLGDPDEEIRLLAYSIINSWQQRISEDLQHIREEYGRLTTQNSDPKSIAQSAKRLSELYLEVIYQGFEQGDMRQYALEQANKYAQVALQHVQQLSKEPILLTICFRLALERSDWVSADKVMRVLMQTSSPTVWAPYAAELAWLRRDFLGTYHHLNHLRRRVVAPKLRPIMLLWFAHDSAKP